MLRLPKLPGPFEILNDIDLATWATVMKAVMKHGLNVKLLDHESTISESGHL